jgi:hypothetical protein
VIASSYDCVRRLYNSVEITSYKRDIFATPRRPPRLCIERGGFPCPWG